MMHERKSVALFQSLDQALVVFWGSADGSRHAGRIRYPDPAIKGTYSDPDCPIPNVLRVAGQVS